ncbi:MetQ/NlpA family ABC transporter substrate-binding protein, partial [Klebsiella pneumoniae]|nr:MetQ/NlpA family ABC transporter substrate-binding protein [Klebsiella pneumoniae]
MLQQLSKLIVASALVLAVSPAIAADSLRIGVVPGAYADSINAAAKDAKAQGINVEVIEFTDWTTPNVAVDNGDIDINYFQHQPFLEERHREKRLQAGQRGHGYFGQCGSVFRSRHQAVDQVPQGG